MAVRTDPDAPKHRGISLLIVPLDSDGIEIQPFHTMAGHRTNLTFYDNVRVSADALVGEENRGWYYMTTQLDFERVAISPVPQMERIVHSIMGLFEDGLGPEESWTRASLASMISDLNVLRVLDKKTAAIVADGDVPVAEASMLKVLSNEFKLRHLADVVQMLGEPSLVAGESPGGLTDDQDLSYESQLRGSSVNLFGGGSNDVQRDLMAIHGLGLPR